MASSVISRDELLEEAYRIADAQGLSALSIRSLAQVCHVSVGTIYNHFASKDKLTTATIELFFRRSVFDGFAASTCTRVCRLLRGPLRIARHGARPL